MDSLFYQSANTLSEQLALGKISSVELTQEFLRRIDTVEPKVQAFLSIDREKSLAEAKASDQRRAQKATLGPLDGIPVGIKDLIAEKGQPLTCASKILEHYISPYDATVIEKLHAAGAVLLGRLNMDEFAMGSSTESSAYHKTYNPWNLAHVPGGSGGGSTAAVAAGELPLALGSDTGGSVRQPAAYCGIYGLKPTYGLISRYGLSALTSSTDQIGPNAREIRDLCLLLQVLAGHDDRDSTSYPADIPNYLQSLKNTQPCRIGIPKEYFGEGLSAEVRESIEAAIAFYQQNGYTVIDITLPHTRYAIPVYYVVMTAEASSNLARFDGIRYSHRSTEATNAIDIYLKSREEGFGPEVKRRILLGTFALSSDHRDAYYMRAQRVRTLIQRDFLQAFQDVDVILTPTAPSTAFKFGAKSSDPLQMYLEDICTVSASLAGFPALAVPCGFGGNNLPIGFQLIGNFFQESTLLATAHVFEREHDCVRKHPEL
ncbi:MAG: Asp-tRNA(Asn)/Glu-tRNA(Gln) amidotransferase subunit GatA [Opitutales bacterium]|nr:Asp-tRNA(Asn)/Glu-tRNA(Gln) amidotransferase subunit GatA [Opitutales bacterium]